MRRAVEPDRPSPEALAIVPGDPATVVADDIAQGIGPFEPTALDQTHQARDVMGLEPIVLVEKGDISAGGQVDGGAVDAVPVEAVRARVERQGYQMAGMPGRCWQRGAGAGFSFRSVDDD